MSTAECGTRRSVFSPGPRRSSLLDKQLMDRMRGSAIGFGLLAAAVLDGIPESLALGVSLVEGGGLALLVAIFIANVPEALGGATRMRDDGRSATYVLGIWTVAAVLIAASVVAGRLLLGDAPGNLLAVLLGFAAAPCSPLSLSPFCPKRTSAAVPTWHSRPSPGSSSRTFSPKRDCALIA